MPNPSNVRRAKGLVRHTLDQLLLVDLFRYALVAARYYWFVHVLRRLRTFDLKTQATEAIAPNTVSHNLKGMRDLAVNRSHLLVRPLSVIEALGTEAKVLSVGPRTEGELFSLAAHGFRWHCITGLDLITYSPSVKLGDMHRTAFGENEFDAVILGWVIAYSEDPVAAAREMIRITRPGGVIAIGVEYSPQSQEEITRDLGYLPGARKRIASTADILAFFGDHVGHVYYEHVVQPANAGEVGSLCTLFAVRKP